jgi:hypothetical protein
MDRAGLVNRIAEAEELIAEGRKWLDTEGFEAKGRLRYREGIALAMETFREALVFIATDLELLIRLEHSFLVQELHNCDPSDEDSIASLEQAIADFGDAFRALAAVNEGAAYRIVELACSHKQQYRHKGMPKDAFHVACISHLTRINNALRTTGLNLVEKDLLKQRKANLKSAQDAYLEMQKAALSQTAA